VLKRRGMRQLLISDPVRADIEARTKRVFDQAAREYSGINPEGYKRPPKVDMRVGPNKGRRRIRGSVIVVHPLAVSIEADRRVLGRALTAAKG
jgi:hypothetical protein